MKEINTHYANYTFDYTYEYFQEQYERILREKRKLIRKAKIAKILVFISFDIRN
jgi:hypothetical protein